MNSPKKLFPTSICPVQNRQYYADLIDYYNRYELNELKRDKMYLYILCYMLNRPRYIIDQLIESILHYVKKYTEAASLYAKEVNTKEALAIAQHLPEGSQLLRFYNDENLHPQSFDTISTGNEGKITSPNCLCLLIPLFFLVV